MEVPKNDRGQTTISITLTRNMNACLVPLAFLACMTGCAVHTYKSYEGPERPSSEIVTILNSPKYAFWSFIRVNSVDGKHVEPATTGYIVLPGVHWYQVWVDRHSEGAMFFLDAYYTDAVCGFSLDAAPGTTYQIMDVDKDEVVQDKEQKMFKATIAVEQHLNDGNPITLRIPAECASWDLLNTGRLELGSQPAKGGFLCRDNSDCLNKSAACVRETAYSYGICNQPDKPN